MFGWFNRWREGSRVWSHGQQTIWPTYLVRDERDLTGFQKAAAGIVTAIVGIQLEPGDSNGTYLSGNLPGSSATIFIYPDGAQVLEGRKVLLSAEREDFATPQDLINAVAEFIRELPSPASSAICAPAETETMDEKPVIYGVLGDYVVDETPSFGLFIRLNGGSVFVDIKQDRLTELR